MSEQQNSSSREQTEQVEKEKVVVSPEDCNAALDFWRHFKIDIPANLQTALDNFTAEQTYANQQKLKLEICLAISTTDHEAFKDEMFNKIVEECSSVAYNMQFDRDLEAEVTVKE